MLEPLPSRQIRGLARTFYRRGWMEGTAGNLSIRQGDTLYITASGRPKGTLSREDILTIPLNGAPPVSSGGRTPSAETSIHQAIYRLAPDTAAVLHIHTIESALVSERLGPDLPLPPLEVLKGLGIPDPCVPTSIPIFENDLTVSDIAKKITSRLSGPPSPVPVLLIRHHGTTAWGKSLEEAVRHLELAEYCFRFILGRERLP